ncbi:MAG: hypothetical protein AB7T63_18200 [Planctomycetota bacterium]
MKRFPFVTLALCLVAAFAFVACSKSEEEKQKEKEAQWAPLLQQHAQLLTELRAANKRWGELRGPMEQANLALAKARASKDAAEIEAAQALVKELAGPFTKATNERQAADDNLGQVIFRLKQMGWKEPPAPPAPTPEPTPPSGP